MNDKNSDPAKAERFKMGKGVHGKTGMALTIRQKLAISEYIKTGKKGASFAAAYAVKTKKNEGKMANNFFKKPKIVDALNKALKDSKFDDQFAVKTLKDIVDGGMKNIDITRPDTALKALETYFKLTNKLGNGGKDPIGPDPESQAKKMDMTELRLALREMDKRQKKILAVIGGNVQEGEIVK